MAFSKSKYTKRFNFQIERDIKSHKAGANKVTIGTAGNDNYYSGGTAELTMTIKEARALNSFLTEYLTPVVTNEDLQRIS